jgi:TP901 family phage tail tape measure protein
VTSPQRDLNVNVTATHRDFDKGMKSAAASAKVFERELKKQDAQITQFKEQAGRAMLGVGVAIAAAGGLAVRSAVQWESAWAGVTKTVDGSAQEMAVLEGQLRAMARELPASHQEIAAVAEAAGQLGIQRGNISEFTRTMIDLGETTNLSAQEAASSMARLANVMGTSQQDFDKLGSALVELGNNSATTEAEILEMALRISGAGKQIGLSEGEVLGFSAALSSVGIAAEAGGSSISRAFIEIASAVNKGGKDLEGFAKVAGMSTTEFSRLFKQDAASAIQSFIEGLGKVQQSGGDTFKVLDDLGLGEIRVRDAMLRMSAAGDLVARSLDLGNKGWEENVALIEEAAKRYQTTEARLQIAKNNINDLGITIGQTLLPALGGAADKLGGFLQVVQDLPGPIKTALGIFGGLVGAVSLVGGAAIIAVPKFLEFRNALDTMGGSASKVNRGLGKVGRFLTGPWGIGIGVAITALGFFAAEQAEAKAHVDDLTTSLNEQSGALTLESGALIFNKLQTEGAADAAQKLGINQKDLINAAMGNADAQARVNRVLDEAAGRSKGYSSELYGVGLAAKDTRENVNTVRDAVNGQNEAVAEAVDKWRQEAEAGLHGAEAEKVVAEAMGNTQAIAEAMGESLEGLAASYGHTGDEAVKAAQEMLDAWSEAFASFVDLGTAYDEALQRKEDKAREVAEATAAATEDASDSWSDFVGDVKVTAQDYIAELQKQVQAQKDWSDNLITLAAKVPPAMLDELAKMGPAGAQEVELLASMTDAELKKVVELWGNRGKESADAVTRRIAEAGPILAAIGDQIGQGTANKIAEGMAKRGTTVFEEAQRQGLKIDQGVDVNRPRIVKVNSDVNGALRRLEFYKNNANRLLNDISDHKVTVSANLVFGGAGTGGTATNRLLSSTGRAQGGKLPGPPSNRDNMLVPMASGEFVVRASQVPQNLPLLEAINSGQVPGFAKGGLVDSSVATILRHQGSLGNTRRDMLAALQKQAEREAKDMLLSMPSGGGAGVERWRGVALQALSLAGSPLSWIGSLLRRMNQESGGNPRAINLWDCLPVSNTVILTRRGWLKHDEVQVGDETIGFNPETGCSEWTRVTRVVHYEQADLVRIGNSRWSVECTPNHRWVTSQRGSYETTEMRVPAEFNSRTRINLAFEADTGDGLAITDDEAELLGWIAADGHVERNRRGASISITVGEGKLPSLTALLARQNVARYRYNETWTTFRLTPDHARDLMARSGHPKEDAFSIVLGMSSSQRDRWLEGVQADGTKQGGHQIVYQCDGPVAEAVRLAGYLSGNRVSAGSLAKDEENWAHCNVFGLCKPYIQAGCGYSVEEVEPADVWCVTTDLGTWTAEQDGQVFLTGNSNAARGIPSKGLMQTIDPTFNAYAGFLRPRGVWDPLANIYASIRYANARYGAAPIGWNRRGGYDSGGLARGAGFLWKGPEPERVLSPRQTESFERLVRILDTQRGSPRVPGSTASSGIHVENLHVRAYSDQFSIRQVQDDLAMHGAT